MMIGHHCHSWTSDGGGGYVGGGEDGDGGVGSTGAAGTLIDGGWSIASGC